MSTPTIPIQADIKTVEATLRAAKIRLQYAVGGPDYALDKHFELYVLTEIETVADARRFIDKLDADAVGTFSGSSSKAHNIRSRFNGETGDFWMVSPERIRAAISYARRTHCGCHETRSFAPRRA